MLQNTRIAFCIPEPKDVFCYRYKYVLLQGLTQKPVGGKRTTQPDYNGLQKVLVG
jgi:hypothetical protein